MNLAKFITQRHRTFSSQPIEPLVRSSQAVAKGAVILFIALTLLFMGCSHNGSPSKGQTNNVSLNGMWNDDYGTIKINASANTFEYVGNNKGKIVNSPNYSEVNGVLIIEFTEYFELDYSDWPNVTSTENPDNIGKFGALYWRELNSDSVYMSEAWVSYAHVMFETIEEAKTAFTMDKASDYVDWSILAPYTK